MENYNIISNYVSQDRVDINELWVPCSIPIHQSFIVDINDQIYFLPAISHLSEWNPLCTKSDSCCKARVHV